MGSGDDEFESRYAELFVRAERVAGRILADRSAAEDVAAETMVRAMGSWRRVRAYSVPWVTRVASNLAIDIVRRRVGAAQVEPVAAVDSDSTDRLAIVQALGELPARQRQALVLRYLVGLSGEEVARAMGLSSGTVKVHLQRGRKAMRVQFADDPEEAFHATR